MNNKKLVKHTILIIGILLVAYTLMMILTSCVPNHLIKDNVNISLNIIEEEGTYPAFFFKNPASRLDNYTDKLMLESTLTEDNLSVLTNSMVINNRTQYWQGYLFFLKPLLFFFNLYQIRYILYTLFFLFFAITIILINKRTNFNTALAYTISVVASNILFTSVSLQFIGIYIILFISIILLFKNNQILHKEDNIMLFFLIIGSITCFIDFLTAPLITLGIPLCLVLIYKLIHSTPSTIDCIKSTFFNSLFWGMGYAFSFIGKWIISCILLRENVFSSSLQTGLNRINGDEQITLDRSDMLLRNLYSILGFEHFSPKSIILFSIILISCIGIVHHFYPNKFQSKSLLLLIIATYPYIWYNVLANHSQIHFWFTYRIQIISIFAIIYILLSIINFDTILLNASQEKGD